MKGEYKKDKQQIVEFLNSLYNADWLPSSQKWWPKYIYHFSNIDNAVQILEDGCLYSRYYLANNQRMITDNASSEVISHTDKQWQKYVRLYFRPKTPTQCRNEGFRPVNQRYDNAHCPVPVFFLFDAKKVLTKANVQYSDGNLASSRTRVYETADDLEQIPFKEVYHDSWFSPEYRDRIIHHRHAEVLIPECLSLEDLRTVICRTEAEYETLLDLLSVPAFNKWYEKIGASKKGNLFYRDWLFIEEVDLNESYVNIAFNDSNYNYDPFNIIITVKDNEVDKIYTWRKEEYTIPVNKTLKLKLPSKITNPANYQLKIYFDKQLMYSNIYYTDIPF